jgi:glutaredoxin
MKITVVYTMDGCPYCSMIKEELDKENIPFLERDIHKFEEEYEEYVNATQNEFVPALMLLTLDDSENTTNVRLLAPDRDFKDIYEGVKMIKDYML